MKFQSWYLQNYEHESQCKFHDNTKNFLKHFYKLTKDYRLIDLINLLERPSKPSKKLNPILLREIDVKNVISAILKLSIDLREKIRLITGILFAAYTGQRPLATIDKLTKEDFKAALKTNPPVLFIPEEKDKESFPHYVPLHPILVEWINTTISTSNKEILFPYDEFRKLHADLDVKAVHTGLRITFSHYRKFFEQMCNNVLVVNVDGRTVPAMHPGLRDYIMAHNTGSLDVQSYDGKLPSEIYEQYMAAWRDVNLLPEGVELPF